MSPRSTYILIAFGMVMLACGGGGGGGGGFVGVPAELVPNLRPLKAADLSIATVDTGSGFQRVLRLSSRIANFGEGPIEIFGFIEGANTSQMVPASQIIRWNNGQTTVIPAGEFEYHPIHSHWHWENLVTFKLYNVVDPVDPYHPSNTLVATTPKVSFCLVDTEKIPGFSGSGQPSTPRYRFCNRNTQGISVGWNDLYAWNIFGQWIVIEGVPDGQYWVILESDPTNLLREVDETDNKSAVKIQITGNTVTEIP